ncbi:MAG: lysophospholipid acyltransferase family protein [Myxococcota bacterium]
MISKLRSAYAWVLLSVLMLALFPAARCYAAWNRHRDPRGDGLRRFCARWIALYGHWTPLYRFEVEGREHLPSQGPFVLVANHESGLDVLCLQMLGTTARFLAEHWLFDIPLSGPLFRRAGHIPVEVGNRESGRAALETAADALVEGTPVAVFPEGQLRPDGLSDFKPGAFVLAQRAGVPLVPVRIVGAGDAWRPGTLVVRGKHVIRIRVLEPVAPEALGDDPKPLSDRVHERLRRAEFDAEA